MLDAARRRKIGHAIRRIARDMGMAYSTVRDRLARMHKEGLRRWFDKIYAGKRRSIPQEALRSMRRALGSLPEKYGFESGAWSLGMVGALLKQEFGIACPPRTLRRTLRRMGFSYIKPRPIPIKSASLEEQEAFKEETHKEITTLARRGCPIFAEDEAASLMWQEAGYGWYRSNGKDTVRVGYSKKSVKMFGVLGKDGYHIKTVEATNSPAFIEFLKDLQKMYPKFVLILDNAKNHKSDAVNKFIDSTKGDIRLIFLPPYTPQLNPIETQWRELKRILSRRYFASLEDLDKTINAIVSNGEMKPVKMMPYLTP